MVSTRSWKKSIGQCLVGLIFMTIKTLCSALHSVIRKRHWLYWLTTHFSFKFSLNEIEIERVTNPLGWRCCSTLQLCYPLCDPFSFLLCSLRHILSRIISIKSTMTWVSFAHILTDKSIVQVCTSLDGDEGTKGAGKVSIDSSTGSRSAALA